MNRRRLLAGIAGFGVLLLFFELFKPCRKAAAARVRDPAEDPPFAPHGDPLRSMWHEVEGLRMHSLLSTGPVSKASPVVLVHGLALSGRYMIPTAKMLAETHRVYVPDLPGFGDSDKPAHVLNVPGLADSLDAWMEAVGLERAMLLGNSFGCQIIADLAARHPERVERAVLQGPTTPPDERTWLKQFIRWQQNSPYNPPSMGEIAGEDYDKAGYVRALRTFQFSLEDKIEEKLPRIAAPTLVVRGSIDPICRQEWAEEVTRLLPDGRLAIIPDVAHTLVYTSAPELVEVSLPFLDKERPSLRSHSRRGLILEMAAMSREIVFRWKRWRG